MEHAYYRFVRARREVRPTEGVFEFLLVIFRGTKFGLREMIIQAVKSFSLAYSVRAKIHKDN